GDAGIFSILLQHEYDALSLGILLHRIFGNDKRLFIGVVIELQSRDLVWLDKSMFIGNGNLYIETPVVRVDGIAHQVHLAYKIPAQGSYLYLHLGAFADLVDVVLRNISSHVHIAEVDDTEELHLPGSYYLPLFSHPLIDYSVKWGPDDTALYLRPHLL